ncbi:hypothetical protein FJZ19_03480 [Candidatus Pacearchaeota archaeon]|nr:hypothetical protein [Candidatus Pacearchaeota archaeon]
MLEKIFQDKEFVLKAAYFCRLCDENYNFSIDKESAVILGAFAVFSIAAGIWIYYAKKHYDLSNTSEHPYNPKCNCMGCKSHSNFY